MGLTDGEIMTTKPFTGAPHAHTNADGTEQVPTEEHVVTPLDIALATLATIAAQGLTISSTLAKKALSRIRESYGPTRSI